MQIIQQFIKGFKNKLIIKVEKMFLKNLQIKGLLFPILPYLNFLLQKIPSKRMMWNKKMFVENLALLIVKNHLALQFVENVWLKHLVLQLCPHVQFPFQKLFSNIFLLKLVEKIKEMYVLPLLNDCSCAITSFDLWMSKGAHVVFVLAIFFLGSNWKPKYVTLGLCEAAEITGQALARSLIELLDAYGLKNKIITYVKDEGSNLNTLTNALKFVVKCETLGLEKNFQRTYFGHVFSKVCQYATIDNKLC